MKLLGHAVTYFLNSKAYEVLIILLPHQADASLGVWVPEQWPPAAFSAMPQLNNAFTLASIWSLCLLLIPLLTSSVMWGICHLCNKTTISDSSHRMILMTHSDGVQPGPLLTALIVASPQTAYKCVFKEIKSLAEREMKYLRVWAITRLLGNNWVLSLSKLPGM